MPEIDESQAKQREMNLSERPNTPPQDTYLKGSSGMISVPSRLSKPEEFKSIEPVVSVSTSP